jgi:hypothetical protein
MAGHGGRAPSELEAATIEVAGGELMFAMTTVGDGFFRVYVDHDDAEIL